MGFKGCWEITKYTVKRNLQMTNKNTKRIKINGYWHLFSNKNGNK